MEQTVKEISERRMWSSDASKYFHNLWNTWSEEQRKEYVEALSKSIKKWKKKIKRSI